MQYAVKSFATRALDEWVLDYPQQVIMTTLNLVLTNEINDILEEKQRQKELEDAEVMVMYLQLTLQVGNVLD